MFPGLRILCLWSTQYRIRYDLLRRGECHLLRGVRIHNEVCGAKSPDDAWRPRPRWARLHSSPLEASPFIPSCLLHNLGVVGRGRRHMADSSEW